MRRALVFPATLAVWALAVPASAQLYLRGADVADARPVVRIAREGAVVGEQASTLIPWYRVKAVLGEHADEAHPYLTIAERSWRARDRLARRDLPLAAELLRPLFEEYDTGDGPTSSMIAHGLLACELGAGEHLRALAPFVATLHDRDPSGVDPSAVRTDAETHLAPELPPFWTPPVTNRAMAFLSEARKSCPDVTSIQYRVASMYIISAMDPPTPDGDGQVHVEHDPDDPGSLLVRDILIARIGSADQRRESRVRLDARTEQNAGTWIEAWCRIGIARSLLRERDESETRRAVIELLHVPSRFDGSERLSMLALAFACDALVELGEIDQAERLAALLDAYDPPADVAAWIESRLDTAPEPTPEKENE